MPIDPDDPAARLQALEVGVIALQHELDRRVRAVAAGDRSAGALIELAFACAAQASLLLALSGELRRRTT